MLIRPATIEDAAAIARVHVDSWRTTYRGTVPDDILAQLSYERREEGWRQSLSRPFEGGYSIFVGEEKARVVGFASGGPERSRDPIYRGELYAIYILEAFQHRGLGRALTSRVATTLLGAGIMAMLVWVLNDNQGARMFYESLGGTLLREQPTEIGGRTFREVAYGWLDLHKFVSRLERR